MSLIDLDLFERTPLVHQPCDFIVVPRLIGEEQLQAINRDYPAIDRAGNFAPEEVAYGPVFAQLLEELRGPAVREAFARKFAIDLSPYELQITVRKYSEKADGNVHNDSKTKIITVLIYFNETWSHAGGQLRLMPTRRDIERFAIEVPPVDGNLLAFRRSERSYHGFLPYEGERRSLQMYWVAPKRQLSAEGRDKTVTLKKRIKRFLKQTTR
jgi:Rps23 Pro-64 3,4-dihydroxylase Tpa1-like proline 4-hydroxylase